MICLSQIIVVKIVSNECQPLSVCKELVCDESVSMEHGAMDGAMNMWEVHCIEGVLIDALLVYKGLIPSTNLECLEGRS